MLNELVRHSELGMAGLTDPFEGHTTRPLAEHVADFRRHLESKGNGDTHVNTSVARVEAVIRGCGFKRIADVSASRVSDWLADRRAADGSIGPDGRHVKFGIASSNHYLTAVKAFTRWLVRDGRTADDRLAHLSRINADTDIRRERRQISPEDFSRLLITTVGNGERCNLSGKARSMLYLTAGYTGLRASELASLTPASFDFEAGTVTVEAAYSKHRRRDVLPLHPELSLRLREWFAERRAEANDASPSFRSQAILRRHRGRCGPVRGRRPVTVRKCFATIWTRQESHTETPLGACSTSMPSDTSSSACWPPPAFIQRRRRNWPDTRTST